MNKEIVGILALLGITGALGYMALRPALSTGGSTGTSADAPSVPVTPPGPWGYGYVGGGTYDPTQPGLGFGVRYTLIPELFWRPPPLGLAVLQ